jgi:hypothetical protein
MAGSMVESAAPVSSTSRVACIAAVDPIDGVAVLRDGETVRWASALARLERTAPIIIVAHHRSARAG